MSIGGVVIFLGVACALSALVVYAGRLAGARAEVTWPEEEPLNPHDDRALDPHLKHLARLLNTDAVDEAHQELVRITRDLVYSPSVFLRLGSASAAARRLGPEATAFLENPPKQAGRYRHHLAAVLPMIEGL